MVQVNVRVPDELWRLLRDVAECDRIRTGGRASVRPEGSHRRRAGAHPGRLNPPLPWPPAQTGCTVGLRFRLRSRNPGRERSVGPGHRHTSIRGRGFARPNYGIFGRAAAELLAHQLAAESQAGGVVLGRAAGESSGPRPVTRCRSSRAVSIACARQCDQPAAGRPCLFDGAHGARERRNLVGGPDLAGDPLDLSPVPVDDLHPGGGPVPGAGSKRGRELNGRSTREGWRRSGGRKYHERRKGS